MVSNFNELFNQRLGTRIGKPAVDVDQTMFRVDPDTRAAITQQNRLFEHLANASVFPSKGKSTEDGGQVFDPVMGNLNQPAVDTILNASQQNIKTEDEGGGGGFFGGIWDAAKDVGSAVGKPVLNAGVTALDYTARPYYALMEGLKEQSETFNEGENFFQSLDNVAGGLWSGLSGQERTGFGDVIEENSKREFSPWSPASLLTGNPLMAVGEGLGEGTDNSWQQRWAKRGLGFAGEIALDPLNYVGVGLVGKIGKGLKYSDDAFRAVAGKTVKEAVEKNAPDIATKLNKGKGLKPAGLGVDGKKVARNLTGFDEVEDAIRQAIDDTTLEISRRGGSQASGRILGADVAPYTVASKATENIRKLNFSQFDDNFNRFMGHIEGKTPLNSKQIKQMRNSDSVFDDFLSEFQKQMNVRRGKNKITSPEEALKAMGEMMGKNDFKPYYLRSRARKAAEASKAKFDDTFRRIQDDIHDNLVGQVYNAPGIRVFGKTYENKGLTRIGKAYADARRTRVQGSSSKALSYARQFPGRTALMNQRIRSYGIRKYEEFQKEVSQLARGINKEQRKEINQAILQGRDLADPKLQSAKEYIEDQYARMFREEMDAGVRPIGSRQADNYTYLYYNKGRSSDIGRRKQINKDSIKSTNRLPDDALQVAKDKGLKPEEDAFRALLLRQIDSNRALTRSWFTEDLLDHYGVTAKALSGGAARGRHLVKVDRNVPSHLKKLLGEGESYYLPRDIREVFDNYMKITKAGYSEDAAGFIRSLDRITRLFKSSATIPYPGFHIRNAIGDIFMSHLDGVKSKDYAWVMDFKRRAAKNGRATTTIGGREFSYDELNQIFRQNASSGGFYNTDLAVDELASKVNPNRLSTAAREASEYREDFFRFTHFMKAFKEEYPNALKNTKNADNALKNAIEASTYRVNKSLFDYGALTAIEKNVLRRAIPFYTYSRKVMPTLMEAAILKPQQLSKTNRLFFDDNRGGPGAFNDMLLPDYLREIGYFRLSDEEEPWILGAQFLPTDPLRQNLNMTDPNAMFRNLIAQSNPLAKGPVEMAFQQSSFNEAPIEPGISGYFGSGSAIPPVKPLQDVINMMGGDKVTEAIPGMRPNVDREGNQLESPLELFLSGRFGAGIPFDQISKGQQTSSVYGLQSELFDKIDSVNRNFEKNGLRLYLSKRKGGANFRVRDIESGEVLLESNDPNEVIQAGYQLARK